jgi:UDP-N-acetyl-D-mannosaminuronate dehydrogenase
VVSFDDPLIDAVTVGASVLTRVADRDAAIASADLVVLVQDHTVYLDVLERIDPGRLLDTRGVTR